MQQPEASATYTWEQYLALEAQSEERYEYHDGRIVAMEGENLRHNQLVGNFIFQFHTQLPKTGCSPFFLSVRLFRYQNKAYFYPDVVLTCNPADLESYDSIKSPVLVVEVLSDATAKIDATFKLHEYIRIPSLRHYLMVAQEECRVIHYFRTNSTEPWKLQIFTEMQDVIDLPEAGIQLTLSQVYERVRFGPETLLQEEEEALYNTDLPQN